ncbi:RNA pseudouridine synthase [Sporosarcina sp. 179-K 3D1 HS]|uniref:RluA family pseudouridine synthase n=1 Tax=Sporosarcina sp. 179-K 3D1 HS TaxID=3232169 RepID=UPI0039A2BB06
MNIPILYEDNHLLIVEKPVNVPVQEDRTGDRDLLTLLKEDIKVRYDKPGNVYLGLVHRLDRPVGGVMVFAKTSKAASRLADELRRQEIGRTYLAVVRGTPSIKKDKLVHYVVKDARQNKVSVVDANQKDAKKAVLDYEVIASSNDLSLLSVNLHTGRPHQIRVQLAAIGCPLYGDQKYGASVNRPGQQIALWANSLRLTHPTKKEEITIESLPPEVHPWDLFDAKR